MYTLPSDLEGMPLSLLEAMSYGNCCLVTDIDECASVVEDKAFIFKKSDVADLQSKLQKACDDKEQVGALCVLHNYYAFVIALLISQILNNVLTAIISNRMFPDFKPKGKLPKEEIKKINGKIKDLFTSHLGYTIVSSADTIVISAFLGLTILAQYQNYYYIMS